MDESYDLGRLVLMLANTILHNRNRHLEALGMTAAQADSLRFFLSGGQRTMMDLKGYLGVTHQTAQGIVSRLAEKGLLRLEQSLADKRHKIVIPTDEGKRMEERLIANGSGTGELLVRGMSGTEKETFVRLLSQAYENVKEDGERER